MRIDELLLLTADLPALRHFYGRVLGLPVEQPRPDCLRVRVGFSRLTFRLAAPGTAPFYHFAFSVPHNQLDAAHAWAGARTALLPFTDGRPIADFPNWLARAFYFHDPAGNILECIARQPLPNASAAPFSAAGLLGLSEAGLVVPDVPAATARISRDTAITAFHRGPSRPDFAVLGDDQGLLVVSRLGRGWLPTSRPAEPHWLRVAGEQAGRPFRLEAAAGAGAEGPTP
jgi:catechol 2,3-dioxygenase-like lactoylglutathione lyase family enzyme